MLRSDTVSGLVVANKRMSPGRSRRDGVWIRNPKLARFIKYCWARRRFLGGGGGDEIMKEERKMRPFWILHAFNFQIDLGSGTATLTIKKFDSRATEPHCASQKNLHFFMSPDLKVYFCLHISAVRIAISRGQLSSL